MSQAGVKDSLTLAAKKVNRPKSEATPVELFHGNERFFLAGRTKWQTDVQIEFDDVVPTKTGSDESGIVTGDNNPSLVSASAVLYDWNNLMQDVRTGSSNLSGQYKGNIIVTQYLPDGRLLERWLYAGAWPKSVDQAGWDMSTDTDYNKVTASFQIDKFFRIKTDASTMPTDIDNADSGESAYDLEASSA